MRASMLDVITQDYVRTARAKGLPRRTVVLKHALRNALLPIITNVGLFIPALVSGAIITETIFGWPGMGQYFIVALGNKDNNTLQAILLLSALFVVATTLNVANFIVVEAAIDFLGAGIKYPDASWGNILANVQSAFGTGNWWWPLFPGVFLVLTVFSINFMGDGLGDALDVRAKV